MKVFRLSIRVEKVERPKRLGVKFDGDSLLVDVADFGSSRQGHIAAANMIKRYGFPVPKALQDVVNREESVTSDQFWECACETEFVHARALRTKCPKCGLDEKDALSALVKDMKTPGNFHRLSDADLAAVHLSYRDMKIVR